MSYWAATVLTSVVQRVPLVGPKVYTYIVGGFSVTNVTLVRVFAAHIILAFIILGARLLHLFYLHQSGSKKRLFLQGGYRDVVHFHRYYTSKDLFCLFCLFGVCFLFLLISPDLVLDAERYLLADPMVTPSSIKPE